MTENNLLRGHNPDVLTCIANLSNDEVFTPPSLAIAMLDQVARAWEERFGEDIWSNPDVKFLDPFTKSGVFLREITSRLVKGLEDKIPDVQERVNHILTRQVYGIAITEVTALIARRSVYCSKWASKKHSICTAFETDDGNIWFERVEHTWAGGKKKLISRKNAKTKKYVYVNRRCSFCGANEAEYSRGDDFESHAYAFIHTDEPRTLIRKIFGEDMQFDVVIGNPPYQLSDGGHGASASPIYQHFVEKALELDPKYAVFITPSRWFAGGKGLDEYRQKMLSDHRMKALVDYPKLYEAFPGVKIRGGVSYFLWDKNHDGKCSVQTIWDGKPTGEPIERYLDQFDVLVRSNQAVSILEKVQAFEEATMDTHISSRKPFGLATNYVGKSSPRGLEEPLMLYANQKVIWAEKSSITVNVDWIDQWKVLMTKVHGTSAAVETMFLSRPIIAEPGTACTETYLVAGHFDTEDEAKSLASYLRTQFARFLVSLRKSTQDAPKHVYSFVPVQSWDRSWTDEDLFAKYGLTDEEISYIRSVVLPMEEELL
ncbi:Eco57I restriction-modification methylase domain-containing protein [Rothia nasimurium]|uniref:Eco57I restriction-modification methylase domain-containing protein n=1 Tax=Rothia nasimurium TaxID=85336 RepID=UPI00162A9648|nr:Eco57I restriction-modification methylase domain-containing protein [Rothia nasimurium]